MRRQFIRLHTSLTEMVKGISQITFSQTYKQQYSITKVGPKLKKMPAFSGRLYAPLWIFFQVHTANVLNLDVFRCFRFFSQKQVVLNFEASDVGLKIFLMAKLFAADIEIL